MDEEELIARLSITDDMSDTLSNIADAGTNMFATFEQASSSAGKAFDNVSSSAASSANAVDSLSSSASNYENSVSSAASSTSYWTSAIGNYDKSAMEATHTTEELIESGYKTVQAFFEESDTAQRCASAVDELMNVSEQATTSHDDLSRVIERQAELLEKNADTSNMSAEAELELNRAGREAAKSMEDLETAQREANKAFEDFHNISNSETASLEEAKTAIEQAEQAAIRLANAQKQADESASRLAKATDTASKSVGDLDDESKKATDTIAELSKTVVAVKIAEWALDGAAAIYELTEAFSEAEKTVVNATGATGNALKELDDSMMQAFGTHHAELSSTAGAIGEINTRMQLTGDKLTDMTGKFLDFSDITGSEVVGSVQNVTKVMNKWNIEQDDTVSVLDKLAYEAQVSGASVDSLESSLISGASTFQSFDMTLDTSIAFLGQLELQGINSGTAIMGLKTAVKNFSDDGLNAADALKKTVNEIANMEDKAKATSLAIDVFGSRAGVELAGAIRNGAISVEMLNDDLSIAEGTLQRTAEAGETLGEKWEKANNKIATAFTTTTQPVLEDLSEAGASVTSWIGDLLTEYPLVAKVVTALGVGLGAVAVGVAAVGVASLKSIPAVATFGTALSSALGPIAAIGGAVAIIAGLTLIFSDAEDAVADYDGTLEECSKEIENTRLAHEKAVEIYGEESDAAKQLEGQLETLTAQYEKGGGVAQDYADRLADGVKKFDELVTNYNDEVNSISDDVASSFVMVSQLEALQGKANKTNADLELMGNLADHLNNDFHCNIVVDYETGQLLNFNPDVVTNAVLTSASQKKVSLATEHLSDPEFISGYQKKVAELEQVASNIPKQRADMDRWLDLLAEEYDASDYLSKFTSDNPNEKYDYAALYESLKGYDVGFFSADNPSNPLRGWGGTWAQGMKGMLGGDDETAVGKFYQQYEDYQKMLETEEGYKAEISKEEGQVRTWFKDMGEEGSADSYIKSLQDTAEKTKGFFGGIADSIRSATDPMEKAKVEAKAFSDAYNAAMINGSISTDEFIALVGTMPEEMQGTLTNVVSEMTQLNNAYEEVYNAAYESYEGQYSLFEKLDYDMQNHVLNTEAFKNATVQNAQEALDSQLAYWTQYSENMDFITSYAADKMNVSKEDWDSFVAYLGSGTEEAAGLLNDVQALLEQGDTEAVEKLINTQSKLQEVHSDTADDLANFETEYDKKMEELVKSTTEAIQKMEIPDEAKTAATKTMDAYLQSIQLGGDKAVTEAQKIATRIANALNVNANVNVNTTSSGTVPGHAGGTTNAEDIFIAGENGPELIIGKQGSTVFPASETDKIINAVSDRDRAETFSFRHDSIITPEIIDPTQGIADSLQSIFIPVIGKTVSLAGNRENNIVLPEHREPQSNAVRNSGANDASEKHIVIDINGGGKIEVSGNADRDSILEVLQDNLKPVLMGIIEQEVYEDGNETYDY